MWSEGSEVTVKFISFESLTLTLIFCFYSDRKQTELMNRKKGGAARSVKRPEVVKRVDSKSQTPEP